MSNCPYCHTDSDGYTSLLPRVGIGNAVIYTQAHGEPHIRVSGPNRCRFQIPIEFCPKCGRDLKKREELYEDQNHNGAS